jgi:hypothetical protein
MLVQSQHQESIVVQQTVAGGLELLRDPVDRGLHFIRPQRGPPRGNAPSLELEAKSNNSRKPIKRVTLTL